MSTPGTPEVSVVIPLYNKARTISRTLQSVQAQTLADWECVIVDDGSTDGSGDVVARFGDPRFRVVRQANAGPGRARNTGAREAVSPFLTFIDADDEWHPGYLAHQVERLRAEPDVAASVTGHERPGTTFDGRKIFADAGIQRGRWNLDTKLPAEKMKVAIDFMHSGATAVRREIFLENGGYFDRNRCTYGEDTWIWLRIAAQYTLWRDPEPLSLYNVEDSELGMGRKTAPPPWPMLTHPDFFTAGMNGATRSYLKRVFGYYALIASERLAKDGRKRDALRLIGRHWRGLLLKTPQARRLRGRLWRHFLGGS